MTKPADWRAWLGMAVGVRRCVWRMTHAGGALVWASVLVATAAMAREHDAVSWWHHPADLLAPFGASLLLSSALFLWCWAALASAQISLVRPSRHAIVFLTGYWMTAPLAWLYGVPIESFVDELTAIRFNLTMLSIVSIWRVLLFSQMVAVQFRIPFLVALPWVLVPCMAVAFVGLFNAVLAVVPIMGGLRLTESQQVVVDFQSAILVGIWWSFIPVVVWMIASVVSLRGQTKLRAMAMRTRWAPPLAASLWGLPIVAAVGFTSLAAVYQPPLFRAAEVDAMLARGDIESAIERMRALGSEAFPASWDPPPVFPDRQPDAPSVAEMLTAIEASKPPGWIVDRLLDHADEIVLRQAGWWQGTARLSIDDGHWIHLEVAELDEVLGQFERIEAMNSLSDAIRDRARGLIPVVEFSRQTEVARIEGLQAINAANASKKDTPVVPREEER